jgi:hypothetical protein
MVKTQEEFVSALPKTRQRWLLLTVVARWAR